MGMKNTIIVCNIDNQFVASQNTLGRKDGATVNAKASVTEAKQLPGTLRIIADGLTAGFQPAKQSDLNT